MLRRVPCEHGGVDAVEITDSHVVDVAGMPVRRALPRRARRTVGAWCFIDHMGPLSVTEDGAMQIGPHPHTGLQTVTWLISGEVVHRDSLGSEQSIRPGQLNLMTAGLGVSHAEQTNAEYRGSVQGLQMWIAQPEGTRGGAAEFAHYGDLGVVELGAGDGTVIMGEFAGQTSPARHDTQLVGVDLDLKRGQSAFGINPNFEHAIVLLEGSLKVEDAIVLPGSLAFLGTGRDELELTVEQPTRAMLVGGVPFEEQLVMWWNFVARTREEISAAYEQWRDSDERFGSVASSLARIAIAPPPWMT